MEKIQLLIKTCHQKHEDVTNKNVQLRQLLEAQQEIIRDFANSVDYKKLEEQKEINEQMEENLDNSIGSSSAYLHSLIESPPKPSKTNQASEILKDIIIDIQGQLLGICKQCIDQNSLSVPITAVLDVEQQMNMFEDKLCESRKFPESRDRKMQRLKIRNDHYDRVMKFLNETLHKKSDSDSD